MFCFFVFHRLKDGVVTFTLVAELQYDIPKMSRPFLVSFISALPVNVVHDKSFTRPTVGSHPTDLVSPLHPLYGLVFEAHF